MSVGSAFWWNHCGTSRVLDAGSREMRMHACTPTQLSPSDVLPMLPDVPLWTKTATNTGLTGKSRGVQRWWVIVKWCSILHMEIEHLAHSVGHDCFLVRLHSGLENSTAWVQGFICLFFPGLTSHNGEVATLPCSRNRCFLLTHWTTHQVAVSEQSVIYYILSSSQAAHIFQGSIVLSLLLLFLFICISSIIINHFTQGPEENLKMLYLSIRIFESGFCVTQCY